MRVIFVCTGNTCRSPLAEGYLKSLGIKNLDTQSRGLCAFGDVASEYSKIVAKESGFDIDNHISKQFTEADLNADMIICLSESHLLSLESHYGKSDKFTLLGGGISDPYGMPLEHYRICGKQIFEEIDKLAFSGAFTEFTAYGISQNDIKDIAKLEKECFSEPWNENAIIESVKNGTKFFVAKCKDKVCGYIGISAILDEGYITNIAVTEDYRNNGIGNMLLNKVFSFAREQGLKFVSLEVRESNKNAISLYAKKGFVREGLRKDFYKNPKENAIIMTRRFN